MITENVAVLGTGALGAQIAFQTAWNGYEVISWVISGMALDEARVRFAELGRAYLAEVADATLARVDETAVAITLATAMAEAGAEGDLSN